VTSALADADWTAINQRTLTKMLDTCLPKVAAPWGKDERKKLKLAALRGQ